MDDPELFAPFFPGDSWDRWRVFLAVLFGLPLTEAQREIYTEHTQRHAYQPHRAREAWMIVGRRGGKSRIAALIAVYLAAFTDHRKVFSPGERGRVPVIARDREQAQVVFDYVRALVTEVPLFRSILQGKPKATSVSLTNNVTIEVHAASFKGMRGYTVVGAVLDEIAFWQSEESVNPDFEIVNAIRPGMLTVPGAMLIGLSSPYARKGILFQRYDDHFGKDGDAVVVWQAPTLAMNPNASREDMARDLAEDEPKASAEWLAEFRRDVESGVSREAVKAVTVAGRYELEPVLTRRYVAFTDPSGGDQDSFTLSIAHEENGKGIVDCVRERKPPFSPSSVVAEFCELLKTYGCTTVRGDHYAGEWPREQFGKHGVSYITADQHKSELYLAFFPALNSGRVELLDHPKLFSQLCALERRTARGGRDTVDHPPGGHDDVVNAVAGALVQVVGGVSDTLGFLRYWQRDGEPEPERRPAMAAQPQAAGRELIPMQPTLDERQAAYERLERQTRRRTG